MTASSSLTALVIPNWNGREHLETCLNAVQRQSMPPHETVLVDNGSTDDSIALVRSAFPWVRIIGMGENAGFAAAVNRGIAETDAPYVALLNNDTDLDDRWLEILFNALAHDVAAGLASCKMLRYDRRDMIDGAGDALTRGGAPFTRGAGEPDDGKFDREEYVFGACAGAALYRRSLFANIGVFDEDFISYYEDVDLSWRALLAGWKCLYVPAAVCYHKRGASGNRMPGFPIRMQERNLTALHVKNLPAQLLVSHGPIMFGSRLRRIFRSLRSGAGRATLLGFIQGIFLIPRMLIKRRHIQASRTVSPRAVAWWMGR